MSTLLLIVNQIHFKFPMADLSLNTNSTFTSNSNLPQDEEGHDQSIILRSRPSFYEVALASLLKVDSKYKKKILSLPKEEGWRAFPIRKYKDFWQSEHLLPGIMAMEEAFKSRPSDVLVASFTKSGTTWLKALTFTVMHRNKYALSTSHPLLKLNPHDCVPVTEYHYAGRDEQYLESLPSPRVLGTHLPFSILPESIKTSKCPIVYICRDPKDVLVSLWHMVKKFEWFNKSLPFNEAFELFCDGRMMYGPIWDHVLEYYNLKSLHSPEKILFLKYEEMMNDPVDGVMRLANFIGCPFSEEEIKNGLVKEIIDFCSFNKLRDLDVNKKRIGNDFYFRKAVVGDWQNHMTAEMAIKIDEITQEKFRNSGFTY